MSEGFVIQDSNSNSNPNSEHLNSSPLLTAGQMLKQARINAGLHVAALAVTLKVSVKRLEALEDGNMEQLPDMVFVRALASGICRTLKVDSAQILEKLPKAALPWLNLDDGSINMPIRMARSAGKPQLLDFLKAPWLIGVLLLVVGAALIYLWPRSPSPASFDTIAASRVLPVSVSNSTIDSPARSDNSTPSKLLLSTVKPLTDVSVGMAATQSNELIATTDNLAAANTDSSVSNTFALVTTNTSIPTNSIVVFKATGQTWVEVKSINGITILKKLLSDGESAGASGTLPLTVIVGRADVTQVEVRGKPVNLAMIAKSNVARFEVN